MKTKIILKKIIYQNTIKTLKTGQNVFISILVRGVNKKIRIVSYIGRVLYVKRNKYSAAVQIKQLIFNYTFLIRFKLNALNLVRFSVLP